MKRFPGIRVFTATKNPAVKRGFKNQPYYIDGFITLPDFIHLEQT